MKKAVIILCVFSLFLFSACNGKNDDNTTLPTNEQKVQSNSLKPKNETSFDTVNGALDISVYYENDAEKLKDGEIALCVAGEVIETRTIISGIPATCSTLKITKEYKGKAESDTIYVVELGGMLDSKQAAAFANKDDENTYPNGLYVCYDNYEPVKVGDEVIFFLDKFAPDDMACQILNSTNVYCTAGAVQGRMTLNNGRYYSDTPANLFSNKAKAITTVSYSEAEFEAFVKETLG